MSVNIIEELVHFISNLVFQSLYLLGKLLQFLWHKVTGCLLSWVVFKLGGVWTLDVPGGCSSVGSSKDFYFGYESSDKDISGFREKESIPIGDFIIRNNILLS